MHEKGNTCTYKVTTHVKGNTCKGTIHVKGQYMLTENSVNSGRLLHQ